MTKEHFHDNSYVNTVFADLCSLLERLLLLLPYSIYRPDNHSAILCCILSLVLLVLCYRLDNSFLLSFNISIFFSNSTISFLALMFGLDFDKGHLSFSDCMFSSYLSIRYSQSDSSLFLFSSRISFFLSFKIATIFTLRLYSSLHPGFGFSFNCISKGLSIRFIPVRSILGAFSITHSRSLLLIICPL